MSKTSTGALLALAWASPCFASGGEGGGGPFSGNIGNALWTVVVFVLVVWVLGKFAWGPLLKALQSREDFIRESLAEAKRDREEAKKTLAQYEEKLHAARADASAIVEEGRRDAEEVRRRSDEQARVEADKMIARAKREIGIAKETAVQELYSLSAELATELASRIIGREIDPGDHARLISESIDELDRGERH
jgi:F-type H+-transporting ATPase subunit b